MENEIREFFHAAAPKPGDDTAFRLELNARLAAAEQIKQFHDREIRALRRRTGLLFAAGLLLGGSVAALFILHPVRLPDLIPVISALTGEAPGQSIPGLSGVIPGLTRDLPWVLAAIPLALLAIILPLRLTRRRNSF